MNKESNDELYGESTERQFFENMNECEEICDECNRKGFIFIFDPKTDRLVESNICNKCKGFGKVDWVDKIKNSGLDDKYFRENGKWFIKR